MKKICVMLLALVILLVGCATESQSSVNDGGATYSTTEPTLEMLPDIEGFTKNYAGSDGSINYNSIDYQFASVSFYIMPATADIIAEMTDRDLTDFNQYRKEMLANEPDFFLSEAVFETISEKTVLTFNSKVGKDGHVIYEYHFLDGKNIIVIVASDLLGNAPDGFLDAAARVIIAH